ncbi:amino acid ABC transporter ATP-binding protein [Brucella anthropi]|jgi:polar amino acid transport system ATP-binding protein|nr:MULTISPECIES: amino acid ABC transporter ATP-binding protein [Brucella/Ochrobactrum group]MCR5939314.1 amino acid ABC transporter ATP-binding protein [Ochrobactrum sp. XJ1]MBA8858432.1 polar amino acid transport system ATP-binding protein [Brucella anthropi]NIH74853.1 polar amino acid transport system ATP-binding protein [Ochrobactrum sp. P20RRXII]PQZ62693.1 amino acid ABC transporter ATP-binding protein [Ochrobactrum sp. MYb49]WKT91869.1 amino acid ABC transporter ATP-binding protein [Bruc
MSAEPMIEVRGLKKSFGEIEVLRNISLTVERGQVVGLIGPSGSGKSTLLRSLNLLSLPDAGYIAIGDQKIDFSSGNVSLKDKYLAAFRANTGMVFQNFNLFPHMSVLDNVMIGPVSVLKQDKKAARELAMELLEKVGLAARADARPEQLSGGQKQRVAIARALAMRPDVMLFDEATSALDPALVGEVLAVIRQLAEQGMTMILVTHEMAFARDVADKVIFMQDGYVVETGDARQVINEPREAATREFLSHFHGGLV